VTGATLNGTTTYYDYTTVAYGASAGRRKWVATHDALGGDDFPKAIAVSPDGSKVFVTGWSEKLTEETGSGSCYRDACRYDTQPYDAATGKRI